MTKKNNIIKEMKAKMEKQKEIGGIIAKLLEENNLELIVEQQIKIKQKN